MLCLCLCRYKRKFEALLAAPGQYEDLRVYKASSAARGSLPNFRLQGSTDRAAAIWLDHANPDTNAFLERLDSNSAQPMVMDPDA